METGKAVGGPRDGVKLSAPFDWDGRVRDSSRPEGAIERYYPGRYVWSATAGTWVWAVNPDSRQLGKTPRVGGYSKKP